MDKKSLQDKELNRIAGGTSTTHPTCRSCGRDFFTAEHEYSLIYVSDRCESDKKRFTCPYCGFVWEED